MAVMLSRMGFFTLRRSLKLLLSFPQEQQDPERFYTDLAHDTRRMLEELLGPISGKRILDVGGGPGFFRAAFADCTYISLELDGGDVRGDAQALPFADNSFDVVFSSNVAEHVPHPWVMGDEMLRVGGDVVLSYTIWLGPFGGHETGLWQHYIGGAFARDRYTKRHGHPPKNSFGTSLFAVSCAEGLRWAKRAIPPSEKLAFPRYHPRWAWWMVNVPGLRELLVSNLVIVRRAA